MINPRMLALGQEPSAIRKLYAHGLRRAAEIGAENVFDYSIGNPSVPAPAGIADKIKELADADPVEVHAYSMSAGLHSTRKAVADNLKQRFGIPATPEHSDMTAGATAALDITLSALTTPGDEVIVNVPYFPEYRVMIETAKCTCVEVMMTAPEFQLDIDGLRAAINEKTSMIIINSPNNPVGCVYSEDNIKALAALMEEKQAEYGHPIYLLSDEPYREVVYDLDVPFAANYYQNTIVCYSWAKSLSLPGERIGYVYVSDRIDNADEVFAAVSGAGRALGFICAPVLFQQVIQDCIDLPTDVEAYRQNRQLLTDMLSELGFEFVNPDGAFYLWVKALEDDAQAFSDRAKTHELLLVPSDSFGMKGWVRCSYCISPETIKNSRAAWEALKQDYAK